MKMSCNIMNYNTGDAYNSNVICILENFIIIKT